MQLAISSVGVAVEQGGVADGLSFLGSPPFVVVGISGAAAAIGEGAEPANAVGAIVVVPSGDAAILPRGFDLAVE